MKCDLALRGASAMLEEEDPLPRPQGEAPVADRDRQMRLRERCAKVSRHVVRPFIVMLVRSPFGRHAGEIGLDVPPRGRCGILLNQQRCGSVAAEDRQNAFLNSRTVQPVADRIRDFVKARRIRSNGQNAGGLPEHTSCLAIAPRNGQRRMFSPNENARRSRRALAIVSFRKP